MTDDLTHFINGQEVAADTPHESINPSDTNDVVARYPNGGAAEVDAAAQAAREQGFAAIEFYTQTKTVYVGG